MGNGNFSCRCQVGKYKRESHGESADVALRNAAVNMLIFLKEQKAAALTRYLKEQKDEVTMPISPEGEFSNFDQKSGMELDKIGINHIASERCPNAGKMGQEGPMKAQQHCPVKGIKSLNKTQLGILSLKKSKQNLPKLNQQNFRPMIDPQSLVNGKHNTENRQYPPEVWETYQSYKRQCESVRNECLPFEKIWDQCVADSILPDCLKVAHRNEENIRMKHTKPWKQLLNDDELKQSKVWKQTQKSGKKIMNSPSICRKSREPHKYKDGRQYRTEMLKHAEGRIPKIDEKSSLPITNDAEKLLPQNSRSPTHEHPILDMDDINAKYLCLPKIWKQRQSDQEQKDELSHELIAKLENMKIGKLNAQKTNSLAGFFLILKSSRNPGMVKLRSSKLGGDDIAQLETICDEESIKLVFEEEEVEVDKGVEDEWQSVVKMGQDLVFSGNGSSSEEAKKMACRGSLHYLKIVTK